MKIVGILICILLLTTCVIPVMGELITVKNSSNDINPLYSSNTILKFIIAGKAIRALHSYWIHVPPSYDGSKAVPLVIVFQYSIYNTNYPFYCFRRCIMENDTKFSEKADQEGFIVVYPNAKLFYHHMESGDVKKYDYNYAFIPQLELNYVDDIGFIRALIDKMKQEYAINTSRIYATGMSAGAMMTYSIGAYFSDVVAAIAPVAGTIGSSGGLNPNGTISYIPTPKNPVSVISFHGTKDGSLPYEGGSYFPSVNESIAFWVEHNGCDPTPEIYTSESGKIIRRTYTNGKNGTEVILYTTIGGDHWWPGCPGWDLNMEISATDLIWKFFEAHPKQ